MAIDMFKRNYSNDLGTELTDKTLGKNPTGK